MVDCSIIIVSWNVREYLRKCLASLPRHPAGFSVEVLVVDNASTDGSLEMIREEFPWVTILPLKSNRGFARANNAALSKAQGKYVFILNPDTELKAGALETLIRYMDTHPDRALVAPKIINPDGTFQQGSIRRDPTLASQLLILLKLQYLFAQQRTLRRYYAADFDPEREQEVEQPMGAALFIRRSALDRIGHFDEGFFLWFEEVDLCKRLRSADEQLWYLPAAVVVHYGGRSFAQALPLAKQRLYNKSALHYYAKHYGAIGFFSILFTIPLNLVMVAVYQQIRKYVK